MGLKGKDLLTISDLSVEEIELILTTPEIRRVGSIAVGSLALSKDFTGPFAHDEDSAAC